MKKKLNLKEDFPQIDKEAIKKEKDSFVSDFKKFITKGNVLDLAVAVVIANAFNAIVNGLVKYIIMPLATYFTSGVSIDEWEWVIREEVLDEGGEVVTTKISVGYGLWLQSIVDFLVIAFGVFVAVRIIKKVERRVKAKELAEAEAKAAQEQAKKDAEEAEKAKLEAKKQADLDAFYANVKRQTELLEQIQKDSRKNDAVR